MKSETKIILLLSLAIIMQGLTMYILLSDKKKIKEDLEEVNEDLDRVFNDIYGHYGG